MLTRIIAGTVALAAAAGAVAATPDNGDAVRLAACRARQAARAALADDATLEQTVEKELMSPDPMIRRYALFRLFERNRAHAVKIGRRFLSDSSPAVRKVAKSMFRNAGNFRENSPLSLSGQNDHAIQRLLTARAPKGLFRFEGTVPDHQAVELWFGKPNADLYVWINGIYLGQFDADNQRGQEFRLDATREVRLDGENKVVVRNAANQIVAAEFTAEVLKW